MFQWGLRGASLLPTTAEGLVQTAQNVPVVTSSSDLETFHVPMHHRYSQYVPNSLLGTPARNAQRSIFNRLTNRLH